MRIYADTHVHIYSHYQLVELFEAAWRNFLLHSGGDRQNVFVLYLTERADCKYFCQLAETSAAILSPDRFRIHRTKTREVLRVERVAGGEMYLVAGRQIKTVERMEVLVLHSSETFEDNLTFSDCVSKALASSGVVVLNWSLGKWMFSRGSLVRTELEKRDPATLAVGDIAARPGILGEPELFTLARKRGFRFLSGSDALPFAGEEKRVASYLSVFALSADKAALEEDEFFFKNLLYGPAETSGKQSSLRDTLSRMLKNYRA